MLFEWENYIYSHSNITFGCERYVPSVPLHKYNNLQKLYFKFNITKDDTSKTKSTLIYGKKYSFDLIDFKTVYSKVIYISKFYTYIPGPTVIDPLNYLKIKLTSSSMGDNFYIDPSDPIEIGYTTYQSEDLYTQLILPQPFTYNPQISDPFTLNAYYITVPLYGYKKK